MATTPTLEEIEDFLKKNPKGTAYLSEDYTKIYCLLGDGIMVMIPGEYKDMRIEDLSGHITTYLNNNPLIGPLR